MNAGAINKHVVRYARESEVDQLAQLWFDGWQDAHAEVVPAELKRLRTLETFRERLQAELPKVRVMGPVGAPAGFHITKQDELYQLYVARVARGSGIAAMLIDNAERKIVQEGFPVAWLACAIGNDRAARFYEKRGWQRVGTMTNHLDTPEGEFLLEVWRYEKQL